FDDSMEAFGHCAIRFPHLRDLRQHGALSLPLASLHLLDAVSYRASFFLRERLAGRCGALGRLRRTLLRRFHGIPFAFSVLKYFLRVHSLRFNQFVRLLLDATSSLSFPRPEFMGSCETRSLVEAGQRV